MRTLALTKRILIQIYHDKRTLALILLAPIAVLCMIYFILNAEDTHYTIALLADNKALEEELNSNEDYDITITHLTMDEAIEQIKQQQLNAAVDTDENNNLILYLDGTDAGVVSKVQAILRTSQSSILEDNMNELLDQINERMSTLGLPAVELDKPDCEAIYVTGEEDGNLFDKFGTALIGVIVFFFVFLIAGINFLNERTSGAMEKLLSTPIRRYEIVCGYLLGFGIMAILQSVLITVFSVYVLGLAVKGNILLVLLVTLLTAINALCLGILLSTVANSEFQMVQFIPIVILPQIFLAGLFRMSGAWAKVGYLVPLHYTAHALTNIMQIGNGIRDIWQDLVVLGGLSVIFVCFIILLLKKQRTI